MKNLRKDNKGFSLVELIVVVLIMAIIAVALAPQVMKWVNNSRITADQNAAGNIKAAVQAAYADYLSKGNAKLASNATYELNNAASVSGSALLDPFINEALGGETYKTQYTASSGSNPGFHIIIEPEGKVTVTCDATGVSLD